MEPGTRVRVKADPGRIGVVTRRKREHAGTTYLQVDFHNSIPQFVLLDQLEEVSDTFDDPIELLRNGKLGRSKDLRSNLTHIRLSGRLANLIYSMETTNTDFYAYQFKPVLNFLESPSNGLLVADEVGLGKTIEAGLIWTELRSRFDTRKLLVLCPAMLQEKWRFELLNRFGVRAEILGANDVLTHFKDFQRGNIFDYAIISSMQGLRPRRGWAEDIVANSPGSRLARFLSNIDNEEPLIDLLVIDEAHYLRNPESMTAKLGRLLRSVAEHTVLLSATPVHLKSRDLYELLNIVDEDTFNQPYAFDEILQANEPLIRARDALQRQNIGRQTLLELLEMASNHPLLEDNRQLKALLENPPTEEDLSDNAFRSRLSNQIGGVNLLGRAVTRTRKREVTAFKVIREAVAEMVPLSPPEREFYSKVTELVREYALRCEGHEAFLAVMPQRQMSSSMPAALAEWHEKQQMSAEQAYEDFGIGDEELQFGPLTQQIIEEADRLGNLKTLREHDSKYNRLKEILVNFLNRNPREKVVLFAYFRATLRYLQARLCEDGIDCVTLMGGTDNRYEVIEKFKSPRGPKVLLSSEVASEGVDLQFCRVLINYDLPWNPMKVEQRIGRIDRIGQKSPVITIWNLFYDDTIDARIYGRLYVRLRIFERTLGELEAVLGDEIRKLSLELLRGELTPEQEEERIEQTAQALANLREMEENLEQEAAGLVAHGDYILNQVQAARELERCITAEDLWIYTDDFFTQNYSGCEFRQKNPDRLEFDIRLSQTAKLDLEQFLAENHLRGQTRLASTSNAPVRCIFQNKIERDQRGRFEAISQLHPLVRFIGWHIEESKTAFYPAVSVELSHHEIPGVRTGTYVFAVERWSLQGVRDIERLAFLANSLDREGDFLSEELSEGLVTVAARRGGDWLSAVNLVDLNKVGQLAESCSLRLQTMYDGYVLQIMNENNDRADLQEKTLRRHQDRQIEKLRELREMYRARGRDSLERATQGRIDALDGRIQRKLLEIDRRRDLRHQKQEVCVGLVRVS